MRIVYGKMGKILIIMILFSFLSNHNNLNLEYKKSEINAYSSVKPYSNYNDVTSLPAHEVITEDKGKVSRDMLQKSEVEQGILKENYIDYNKILSTFNNSIDLQGSYESENKTGNLTDKEVLITFPEKGNYIVKGNVSDLKANIIQNFNAETNEKFYADDVNQAGIALRKYVTNNNLEGNYSWKLFVNNTTPIKYSSYMKDLSLFSHNIMISYDYKFESNSSIQNVVNSSVIFDFTFDTCRIMVYQWLYSNIGLGLVGQNETYGEFDTLRLVRNATWDDNWKKMSINVSQLLEEFATDNPSQLEGFGIFITSPELSASSFFIDNLKIETQPTSEEINLKIDNTPVYSTIPDIGFFELEFQTEREENRQLTFSLNTSYLVEGKVELQIIGNITLNSYSQLILSPPKNILYNVSINNITKGVNRILITTPLNWSLVDYGYTGVEDVFLVETEYSINYTIPISPISSLTILFSIFNYLEEVNVSNTVFETFNANLTFKENIQTAKTNVFWFGKTSGGTILDIVNNTLCYQFPSTIPKGNYKIILLNLNTTFYYELNITLNRYAADIFYSPIIDIAKYGSTYVDISYYGIESSNKINNSIIHVFLDNNEIYSSMNITDTKVIVSSFYLGLGAHLLTIIASSDTHASVRKDISIFVYDSALDITFKHTPVIDGYCAITVNLTSDGFPVAFAPLKITVINGSQVKNILSAITNEEGIYYSQIQIPLSLSSTNVSIDVLRYSSVIETKIYEIINEVVMTDCEQQEEEHFLHTNITYSFKIKYSTKNTKWFLPIDEELPPIHSAYIDTGLFIVPVFWDDSAFYWELEADSSIHTHILVVIVEGPQFSIEKSIGNREIQFQLYIYSSNFYRNLSTILYSNTSKPVNSYAWKLTNLNGIDITDKYKISIFNNYIKIGGIQLEKGTYLLITITGVLNNFINNTTVYIPLTIGTTSILAISFFGFRIYKKRKSFSIEF